MWCELYCKHKDCHQHVNERICYHKYNFKVLGGFVCKVESESLKLLLVEHFWVGIFMGHLLKSNRLAVIASD